MYQKTVAALSERVAPHVALGNDRRETLGQLTLGLVSARTANLSVLAGERVAAASTASTYRRYQRSSSTPIPGRTGQRRWWRRWAGSQARAR